MTESSQPGTTTTFGQRWSKARQIAMIKVKGPRSLLLADEPGGLNRWLSPLLRMIVRPLPIGAVDSFALYYMPVGQSEDANSLLVLRRARWHEKADRHECLSGKWLGPSVTVSCAIIAAADWPLLHTRLSELDNACPSFPYVADGLSALTKHSTPMKGGTTVDPSTVRCLSLWRATRFYTLEYEWWENCAQPNVFDSSWANLWHALQGLSTDGQLAVGAVVEKYGEAGDVNLENQTEESMDPKDQK